MTINFATFNVLDEIRAERKAQDAKWGEQNHPNGTGGISAHFHADVARNDCNRAAADGRLTWRHILDEEVAEAIAESDPAKLRAELIQVGAVVAAWIEALDRR